MTKLKKITHNDFAINPSKITIRPIDPNNLEAELLKSEEGSFIISFELSGNKYDCCRGKIIDFKGNEKQAKEKYKEIVEKLTQGKYKLYLYTDGKFDVNFDS
tara:strand:+ start:116 stop:421 length:306 start_codon:yes stop_codon:yes gene_type:complete